MKTYIFGHKNPDTDSVCSSIAYAYLKQKLGMDAEPRVLGDLNLETKFVLKYFNVIEPRYLNDVKIQIRNMKYLTNTFINESSSLQEAFNMMHELNITGLPVVDKDKYLKGYINLKDICKYIIDGDMYHLHTSYDNIIKTLNAKQILRFDEEIEGNLIVAAYKSQTFMDSINIDKNTILIVGDRANIMEYAINSCVKMVIVVGDFKISAELLVNASINKVNIITTPNLTYESSNKIRLANYVYLSCNQKEPITFNINDYRDEFISVAEKSNHTNYPVVTTNNKCLGMIRLVDQNDYDKCNCILVDHNQDNQSVDGISEANILEVIDHHSINNFNSNLPISFRVMPVGCCSTIIYQMYQENNIEIPISIAGLMLSAILSDTLLLKSPTTTSLDRKTANKLSEIANIDIEKFGIEMFKAGTKIDDMDVKDIFEQDFKTYKVDNYNIGISQIMTLNIDSILNKKAEYHKLLEDMKNFNYRVCLLFVTDVIKNGSYIFYNEGSREVLINAYQLDNLEQGMFLEGIVSRKKQMIPKILDYLQK